MAARNRTGIYLIHQIVDYSNPLGFLEYMALMGLLLEAWPSPLTAIRTKEDGLCAIESSGNPLLFSRLRGRGTKEHSKH